MTLQEALTTARARYTGGTPVEDMIRAAKDNICTDCRVKYHHHAMEFDHVRGQKLFDISKATSYSKQRVEEELAKCELVCANCHRIRTHRRKDTQ